jgi:hypothetical protein
LFFWGFKVLLACVASVAVGGPQQARIDPRSFDLSLSRQSESTTRWWLMTQHFLMKNCCVEIQIQLALLNATTLGQAINDYNNWMITLPEHWMSRTLGNRTCIADKIICKFTCLVIVVLLKKIIFPYHEF